MRWDDIIEFWGVANLKRWSAKSLQGVAITVLSRSFLMEVGLPFRETWTLRFDSGADDLPHLPARSGLRRIGFDDEVPICLDEEHGGCVIAMEEEIGGSDRFINSNIERFGEFLVYYQQYRNAVRHAAEDKIQNVIETAAKQMREADPAAFDNLNNWWPVIIEQMNQGLL